MCVIFGTVTKHHCQESKKILKDIFYYAVHSGNKFFNYALITDKDVLSMPNNDPVNTNQIINHIPDNSIFLCYCTKKMYTRMQQPLFQDDVCFLYTGKFGDGDIIDLQRKFSIILRSQNEGEIFLTKMLDETHLSILKYPGVELFGVWSKGNTLYTLRNNKQPGYWMEKHGNMFFSSTNKMYRGKKRVFLNDFELIPANEITVIGKLHFY